MATLSDLRQWLGNNNVAAFLRVIREGESSNDDAGYFMRYPNKRFDSLASHPQIYETTPDGRRSSAAGAYQITYTTWSELVSQYAFSDFSRDTQDIAAVALLARRNAIEPLLRGDLDTAIDRCRLEWTSLPGAAENHLISTAKARAIYVGYGGQYAPVTPPTPEPRAIDPVPPLANSGQAFLSTAPDNQYHPPMLPVLIPVILQALASALPALGPLFGTGEVALRNQKVGAVALDAAVQAVGATNAQDALEKIQSDKDAASLAQAAIMALPEVQALMEVGGGIESARKAAAVVDQLPFYKNQAFVVSAMLLPLVYLVTAAVVFQLGGGWSETMRAVVVTAIMSGVLGSVTGFFLGSSMSSQKKDAALLAR